MPQATKDTILREVVLTSEQLAARWSMAVGTLKNWRAQGKGPPFIPLTDGERPPIVYRLKDVIAYEKARRKT